MHVSVHALSSAFVHTCDSACMVMLLSAAGFRQKVAATREPCKTGKCCGYSRTL